MKKPHLSRSIALLGLVGACASATLLVPSAAQADGLPTPVGAQPGKLTLTPDHGNMTTNPAASWAAQTACPDGFQSAANVSIVTVDDGGQINYHTASTSATVTGTTPPAGTMNNAMATFVQADGLTSGGTYEVVVRCLDDSFNDTPVQSTFIQIAADGNSWSVVSQTPPSTPVDTTTTLSASPTSAAQGDDVTLTAAVTGAGAAGQVEFFDGATSLGTSAVSGGSATKTVSSLPVGDASLTAKFEPTDPSAFNASTSAAVTVTITQASTPPSGLSGKETINVDIPAGSEGDLTFTVPAGAAVQLSTPTNTGSSLESTGSLQAVTVNDGRTTSQPGWSVTGEVSDFTAGSNTIDGDDLGWTPAIVTPNTKSDVTAGAAVAPGSNPGLKEGAPLASATATHGVGTTVLGGDLKLDVPVDTTAGTYSATLTLTAMSK